MERLKKVVSSSSRVIANLQQAASETFQTASQQQQAIPNQNAAQDPLGFDQTIDQFHEQQQLNDQAQVQSQAIGSGGPQDVGLAADADAGAQILASQASAHLTEEEREILLQVFRRQEQFRLDNLKHVKNGSLTRAIDAAEKRGQLPSRRVPLGRRLQSPRSVSSLGASSSASNSPGACQAPASSNHEQLNGQCPSSISSSSQGSPSTALAATPSQQQHQTNQLRPASVTSHLTSRNNTNKKSQTTSNNNNLLSNNNNAPSTSQQAHSSSSKAQQAPSGTPIAASQCPICWKLINELEERTHFCSNCNKFICDDCASYSTSEQDWICSSCRRRAMKQAVPADSLRELGIEPSDPMLCAMPLGSMQRRMTLRPSQQQQNQLSGTQKTRNPTSAFKAPSSATQSQPDASAPGLKGNAQQQSASGVASRAAGAKLQQTSDEPKAQLISRGSSLEKPDCNSKQLAISGDLEPGAQSSNGRQRSQLESGSLRRKSALPADAARMIQLQQEQHRASIGQRPMGGSMGGVGAPPPSQMQQQQPLPQPLSTVILNEQQQVPPPVKARTGPPGALAVQQAVAVSGSRRASVATTDKVGGSGAGVGLRGQLSRRTSTLGEKGGSRPMSGSQAARALTRKQSIVTFYAPGPMYSHAMHQQQQYRAANQNFHQPQSQVLGNRRASIVAQQQQQQQQLINQATGQILGPETQFNDSKQKQPQLAMATEQQLQYALAMQKQQQHQQQLDQQAHSNANSANSIFGGSRAGSRTTSRNSSQHSLNGTSSGSDLTNGGVGQPDTLMIPIPPDQMHLRRLSDQSNLVRRSSIIADTLDVLAMSRHRSHSNIDSSPPFPPYFYQQQQQLGGDYVTQQAAILGNPGFVYSDENLNVMSQQQQRFATSYYQANQHQTGNDEQQQFYNQDPSQQQQHQMQQLSSIITPYKQKQLTGERLTACSGDMGDQDAQAHSDSSSDIKDFPHHQQPECLNQDELPIQVEYFAVTPRALSSGESPTVVMQHQQHQQLMQQSVDLARRPSSAAAGMAIPSVSVSEFRSNQQRLISNHDMNNQKEQQMQMQQQERTITSTMQINVAIEQAIEQQRRRQSTVMMQGNEPTLLGYQADLRRNSSGRALPNIPGEQQSRSLLELSHRPLNGLSGNQTLSGRQVGGSGGSPDDSQSSSIDRLNLPGLGHVRRASAPEGQNIKIVVDDIDQSGMMGRKLLFSKNHHQVGVSGAGLITGNGLMNGQAGGEYLERVILYRDDTLDPSTNMARGFGLRVMGGKIVSHSSGQQQQQSQQQAEPEKLESIVTWVLPGGPADKVGIKQGDQIIEWDGKCLLYMSYEQVAEVIENSANIAELLIKPANRLVASLQNYIRSQRRLSQQTERDLRRSSLSTAQSSSNNMMNSFQLQQAKKLSDPMYPAEQKQQSAGNNSWQAQHNNNSIDEHQQQQNILNNPILQVRRASERSGTGRMLPAIPGVNQAELMGGGQLNPAFHAGHRHSMSLSTGELESRPESTLLQQQNQQLNNQLSAMHPPNYQSRSTGQLGDQHHAMQPQQQQFYSTNGQDAESHEINLQNQRILAGSPNKDEIIALIGLQVQVDERQSRLQISVLSAININLNVNHNYYVRIGILPESADLKPCTTQVSGNLNWKETFLYQNFPISQMHRMAFDVALWPWLENQLTTEPVQPVCEIMIPVQSAREKNTDFWPMRALINTNQLRRKSLNDLIESQHHQQQQLKQMNNCDQKQQQQPPSVITQPKYQAQPQINQQHNYHTNDKLECNIELRNNKLQMDASPPIMQQQQQQQLQHDGYDGLRRRSSVFRHSVRQPGGPTGLMTQQPRRASDEVAQMAANNRLSAGLTATNRRSKSVINVNNNINLSPQQVLELQLKQQAMQNQRQQMNNNPAIPTTNDFEPQTIIQAPQQQQTTNRTRSLLSATRRQSSVDQNRVLSSSPGVSSSVQTGHAASFALRRRSSVIGQGQVIKVQQREVSEPLNRAPLPPSAIDSNASKQDQQLPIASSIDPDQSRRACSRNTEANIVDKHLPTRVPIQIPKTSSPQAYLAASPPSRGAAESGGAPKRAASSTQLVRKDSLAKITLQKLTRNMSFGRAANQADQANQPQSRLSLTRRKSSSSSAASETLSKHEDKAVTKRVLARDCYVGQLKISLVVTKGHLELEIICAQDLRLLRDPSLGVYVKVYVKGGINKTKGHKKKTRIVYGRTDSFQFKQLIKYDASLVDNRILEISVWQKQGGMKGKIALGTTEIVLANLELARIQTSWYNLRPHDVVVNSSIEEG